MNEELDDEIRNLQERVNKISGSNNSSYLGNFKSISTKQYLIFLSIPVVIFLILLLLKLGFVCSKPDSESDKPTINYTKLLLAVFLITASSYTMIYLVYFKKP